MPECEDRSLLGDQLDGLCLRGVDLVGVTSGSVCLQRLVALGGELSDRVVELWRGESVGHGAGLPVAISRTEGEALATARLRADWLAFLDDAENGTS